jgi:hypothetical protein
MHETEAANGRSRMPPPLSDFLYLQCNISFFSSASTSQVPYTIPYLSRAQVLLFSHGVKPSPLGTAATDWPIAPAHDDDDCGVIGGIRIGRGNRSTLRKPVPAPLCPTKIPHDLSQAAAMGSRRLTAWAMAHLRKCLLSHGCSGSHELSHVFHEHPC